MGQVLEIPRQAVEEIQLTIPQPAGRTAVLALARLGAYQDNKVVKLSAGARPPGRLPHRPGAEGDAGARRRPPSPRPPTPDGDAAAPAEAETGRD